MIDTHCHLLPGLDDGAPDMAAAEAMARVAAEDGVSQIVATPHSREWDYNNERSRILTAVEALRVHLKRAGIPLRLHVGAEVHLTDRLVAKIRSGQLATFGDAGKYLLLECPYRTPPVRLEETIFELRVAGITPVLAHPERIRWFQEDLARLESAIRLGALGQMTSSSLVGDFGRTIAALAETMVRRGLVHARGSDAHDTEHRPPRLAAARARWAELAGDDAARIAVEDAPRAFLGGTPFEAAAPSPAPAPRGFLDRLLGR